MKHGTHTGYRQHQCRGDRGVMICDPCREAWNAYMSAWQRANYSPEKRRAAYERHKARHGKYWAAATLAGAS